MTASKLCRRFAVALLAAAVVLSLPGPTRAQATSEDAASPQAKYRKAHQAMGAKDWEEARRLLLELWAEAQTYDVAASLGQVEYWLKHYADGARYLSFALRHIPPAEKAEAIERIKSGLTELKKYVGSVDVSVNESGADILVDDVLAGKSPLGYELYVDVGPHRVEARRSGAAPASTTVDALAGQSYRVELTLESAPGAEALPPVAGASETAPGPVASAPRRKKKSPVPLYVAGGVAAVGAGVGIAFTLAASSTSDEIDDLRAQVGTGGCQAAPSPACSDLQDAVERRDTQRNASYISFAVAGAAVVAGIVYFVWPTRSTRTSSIGISPLPGGSLVTVAGTL